MNHNHSKYYNIRASFLINEDGSVISKSKCEAVAVKTMLLIKYGDGSINNATTRKTAKTYGCSTRRVAQLNDSALRYKTIRIEETANKKNVSKKITGNKLVNAGCEVVRFKIVYSDDGIYFGIDDGNIDKNNKERLYKVECFRTVETVIKEASRLLHICRSNQKHSQSNEKDSEIKAFRERVRDAVVEDEIERRRLDVENMSAKKGKRTAKEIFTLSEMIESLDSAKRIIAASPILSDYGTPLSVIVRDGDFKCCESTCRKSLKSLEEKGHITKQLNFVELYNNSRDGEIPQEFYDTFSRSIKSTISELGGRIKYAKNEKGEVVLRRQMASTFVVKTTALRFRRRHDKTKKTMPDDVVSRVYCYRELNLFA